MSSFQSKILGLAKVFSTQGVVRSTTVYILHTFFKGVGMGGGGV